MNEAQATARALDGFNVTFEPATGDKATRAKPISTQAEAGNVKIVRAPWNDDFIRELENFPTGRHDDQVDALRGGHAMLSSPSRGFDAQNSSRLNAAGITARIFHAPEFSSREHSRHVSYERCCLHTLLRIVPASRRRELPPARRDNWNTYHKLSDLGPL